MALNLTKFLTKLDAFLADPDASTATLKSNVTIARAREGGYVFTYHKTAVVRVDAFGVVVLHNGGWQTVTTKEVMSAIGRRFGFAVYQHNKVWYVSVNGTPGVQSSETLKYENGMAFTRGRTEA
ncbi:MAG: hypothetical protein E6R04_04680 [Spirochaetes bacterium]|nr:MAG: hypothetical protein E6R04_04680 [Spirochaetota bacterium]